MNYFGLFYTFMIPGILIGFGAASVYAARRKQARAQARQRAGRGAKPTLYIHNMKDSAA